MGVRFFGCLDLVSRDVEIFVFMWFDFTVLEVFGERVIWGVVFWVVVVSSLRGFLVG